MTRLTRREAITGTAGIVAAAGGASVASAGGDQPTDAVVDADREGTYPKCVYKPTEDGTWDVALPINVHARVSDEQHALDAVTDAFTGFDNLRWTRVFPDSTAKAWDRSTDELVAPDRSFRRLRLGDEWDHIHIWAVDGDRVAIHAHLDVLDLTASHFHRGDKYDEAAREVADQLRDDGWTEQTDYNIDYGVDDDRLDRWGETGDAKLTRSTSP